MSNTRVRRVCLRSGIFFCVLAILGFTFGSFMEKGRRAQREASEPIWSAVDRPVIFAKDAPDTYRQVEYLRQLKEGITPWLGRVPESQDVKYTPEMMLAAVEGCIGRYEVHEAKPKRAMEVRELKAEVDSFLREAEAFHRERISLLEDFDSPRVMSLEALSLQEKRSYLDSVDEDAFFCLEDEEAASDARYSYMQLLLGAKNLLKELPEEEEVAAILKNDAAAFADVRLRLTRIPRVSMSWHLSEHGSEVSVPLLWYLRGSSRWICWSANITVLIFMYLALRIFIAESNQYNQQHGQGEGDNGDCSPATA